MSTGRLEHEVGTEQIARPKTVLSITTLLSPFQMELAQEINRVAPFDYHVAFTMPFRSARGKHWGTTRIDLEHVHVLKEQRSWAEQAVWVKKLILDIRPDAVMVGIFRKEVYSTVQKAATELGISFGFWMEPPNFRLLPSLQWAINLLAWRRLREADFILAIGDRAEYFARQYVSRRERVHLVPYGQDLSLFLAIPEPSEDSSIIRFLFSGQLVKRHNIRMIFDALTVLLRDYPGTFQLIIAAHGPEEVVIQNAITKCPELGTILSFDRDYAVWEDRVRPFSLSDVLVYPSSHSGWGLVVPEAMAAGLVVISTRYIEAARYYLRHRINGILIEPKLDQLVTELKWCIDHREAVSRMGIQARVDSRWGSAEVVASQFVEAMLHHIDV